MHEQKIVLLGLLVVIYVFYSAHKWFNRDTEYNETIENSYKIQENLETPPNTILESNEGTEENTKTLEKNKTEPIKLKPKAKTIPLYFKNACSVLQIFTEKQPKKVKILEKITIQKQQTMEPDQNAITSVAIMIFLAILSINAILDAIKVKEEENARKILNPDGERRQSLAEFANKKTLRRESSRFGFNLFQIAEASTKSEEEHASKPKTRPSYTRGQSINSYLGEKNSSFDGSLPASAGESASNEPKLVKRQSVAKLFGARPMVRRSSFPALHQNPDIQAAMLGHKQCSFDSDDEGDGKGRRVRIIRRY